MISLSGSLDQGALPRVLRDVYIGRQSGTLRLTHNEEEHSLQFHQGQLIDVTGAVADHLLAGVIVEQGLAAADSMAKTEASAQERSLGLGRILSEEATIASDDLDSARVAHARRVLERVAKWEDGHYTFTPDDTGIPGAHAMRSAPTGDLIIDAVRAMDDPDVVRFALGNLSRPLAPSTDPLLRYQKVRLSPTEGYIMSRIDGVLSAEEISQLVPASPEEILFSLCALYSAGLVDFIDLEPRQESGTPPSRRPAAPPAPPPARAASPSDPPQAPAMGGAPPPLPPRAVPPSAPPQASARVSGTPTASPAPPPPQPIRTPASGPVPSPPAAQQRENVPPQAAASGETGAPTEVRVPLGATPIPVAGPEQESRRKEIGEAFAALKGKTHFQVLELDGSATDSQIKEAYFRLARRFHPDVLRGPAYADLGDQIKAIFIRLGQAYEVLRNHDRRAQYQSTLSKRAPTPSAPAPAPTETGGAPVAVPVPPSAANLEIDAQLAANAIRQAEKLLEQERYWDAIQLVEGHFEHAAPKVRARARVVLAKCYLKNPNWAKRAEEQLLALVAEEPKHVEGHYLLGTIYREKGMRSRALARMKKVLELEPNHEEARARAAELEPPPEPEEPSGGGFVKRLFGRGGGSGA